jgi:hypothetical protein
LTKELHYQHVEDFLLDQTSAELTGWIEHERLEDERRINLIAYAIAKAFNGDKKKIAVKDEEEIIDTTQPEFVENFRILN